MRTFTILLATALASAACLEQPPRPGPGPDPDPVDAFVPLPDTGSGSGFDALVADVEHSGSRGIPAGAGDALDRPEPDALVDPHRRAAGLRDDHQLLDHR